MLLWLIFLPTLSASTPYYSLTLHMFHVVVSFAVIWHAASLHSPLAKNDAIKLQPYRTIQWNVVLWLFALFTVSVCVPVFFYFFPFSSTSMHFLEAHAIGVCVMYCVVVLYTLPAPENWIIISQFGQSLTAYLRAGVVKYTSVCQLGHAIEGNRSEMGRERERGWTRKERERSVWDTKWQQR